MKHIRPRKLFGTPFAFRWLMFVMSVAYLVWTFFSKMDSPVALKLDVTLHPALMRVTSPNHTHQQEMVHVVTLKNTIPLIRGRI